MHTCFHFPFINAILASGPVPDSSGNGGMAEQIQAGSAERAENPVVSKTAELGIHSGTVIPGWLTFGDC